MTISQSGGHPVPPQCPDESSQLVGVSVVEATYLSLGDNEDGNESTKKGTYALLKDKKVDFADKSLKEKNLKEKLLETYPEEEENETYRSIILVVISQFMGYACLVSFQHKLKGKYHIGDEDSHSSHEFSFAVAFLYVGNLIFRLMHNIFFCWIRPRYRVYLSMGAMALSMFICGIVIFSLSSVHISWIYIAYMLGGVGIGTFESNLLTEVTQLGHSTKLWAVQGMPIGFAIILIGGFTLTGAGVHPVFVYITTLFAIVFGAILFAVNIPVADIKNNGQNLGEFLSNMKKWKEWFPQIWMYCFALMVDMFNLSLFSGLMLYIFNGEKVPLTGSNSTFLIPHDYFFVIFNFFTMCGDNLARKLAYGYKRRFHPCIFLVLTGLGAFICLTKYGVLAPFGIFLVFFTNGSVYASSTKFIDIKVDKQYNLTALSVWLAIGDVGSVCGSMLLSYIRDWTCDSPSQWVCITEHH